MELLGLIVGNESDVMEEVRHWEVAAAMAEVVSVSRQTSTKRPELRL